MVIMPLLGRKVNTSAKKVQPRGGKMNRNSELITVLCSHLCVADGIKPLEPSEWSRLAEQLMSNGIQPEALLNYEKDDYISRLNFSEDEATRLIRLVDRGANLRSELSKYEAMGIQIITRADSAYPKQLKKKLGNTCPPLFYCAGDLSILNNEAVGYVGSRTVEDEDIRFTRRIVSVTAGNGYAVVSGGARGVDSISAAAALAEGACVIEYISDSLLRRMREIRDGRVLLMSAAIPGAGFSTGMAMMRNRYIYAQSEGTVVVRSDKGRGGTWAGATENLRKGWCPTFCRDCGYPGNRELIRLGAAAITEEWDGNPKAGNVSAVDSVKRETVQQISLFD